MTYSIDIRKHVLKKPSQGSSISRNLTKEFQISPQTIQSWKKNPEIQARKRKPLNIDNDALRKDIKMYTDDYQHGHAVLFNCSQSGIGKALTRLEFTQKRESKTC